MGVDAYRELAVLLIIVIIIILKGNTFSIRNSSITPCNPEQRISLSWETGIYAVCLSWDNFCTAIVSFCLVFQSTKRSRRHQYTQSICALIWLFCSRVLCLFIEVLPTKSSGEQNIAFLPFKVIVFLNLSADNMWQGKESRSIRLHLMHNTRAILFVLMTLLMN